MASRFTSLAPMTMRIKSSKTLTANVGPDNFHYVVAIDPLEDDLGLLE